MTRGNPPLLAANSKLVENFNQAAGTRWSGDNKEKLSRNIHSEYVSDFCHDRKSAFKPTRAIFLLTIAMQFQEIIALLSQVQISVCSMPCPGNATSSETL